MHERRGTARSRTILGGTISFNSGRSTLDCVVRNLSERGARIQFSNTALLPDVFDLRIARKDAVHRACVVWWSGGIAGLAFVDASAISAIPLARVSRMRSLEAQQRALQHRIDDLGEGSI